MKEKSLKNKAIKFKGKDYVQVSDRVMYLSDNHEGEYSIESEYELVDNMFIVKAKLTLKNCVYTGLAQEVIGDGYINKTSALENAETSAIGRACAMAGIGVIESISSMDEIAKANNRNFNNKQKVDKKSEEKDFITDDIIEKPEFDKFLSDKKSSGVTIEKVLSSLYVKYNIDDNMKASITKTYNNI